MKKLALLFAAAAVISARALAGDRPVLKQPSLTQAISSEHLDPQQPVPNDRFLVAYDKSLHEVFKEAFASDVRVRMLAEPSFEPEYAVGIRDIGGIYHILYLHVPSNLWYSGEDRAKAVAERCDVEIDTSLANRIIEVWRRMLQRVPPHAEVRMGLDGDGYDFFIRSGKSELTEQTWSPDKGTSPAMLVNIGVTMTSYCETKSRWYFTPAAWYLAGSLDRQANALLARLPEKGKGK